MKNNTKLGAVLAVLGILAGTLCLYFLADTYNTVIHTHFNAATGKENTVRIVYAVLAGWEPPQVLSLPWFCGASCINRTGHGSGEQSPRPSSCWQASSP